MVELNATVGAFILQGITRFYSGKNVRKQVANYTNQISHHFAFYVTLYSSLVFMS